VVKDSEVGSHRLRSPVAGAAILLAIYVAMYLAVAAIIRVLTPPDAIAQARAGNGSELVRDTSASSERDDRAAQPAEHSHARTD
jgi:hypothetical protein